MQYHVICFIYLIVLVASLPNPQAVAAVATNNCHGITGNVWVQSRDVAVTSAEQFCRQTSTTVE
jgi:hypothetical protein